MIYYIRSIIAGIIVFLGLIHLLFTCSLKTPDDLWFVGAGIAVILSGILNFVSVINCQQRWLNYLTLAVNIIMLGLFLLACKILQEPQTYAGIFLYLVAATLSIRQLVKGFKKHEEYKHFTSPNNEDLKEVLSETKVVPMLRILDKSKAEEFYIDWLGFKVEWEHRFFENAPVYMEISKAGVVLHLTEHHGDCMPGGKVYIICKGLKEYHRQLMNKNYPYNRPGLEVESSGALEMTVLDPFGNKLLFTESNQ